MACRARTYAIPCGGYKQICTNCEDRSEFNLCDSSPSLGVGVKCYLEPRNPQRNPRRKTPL
jgi:hypothetical protein